jgi:EAL domain-containing protein (putative c-di-GMP-specific phosphodiesterase class I)
MAEEAGLMVRLTDFVLHCACRQLRAWQLPATRRWPT